MEYPKEQSTQKNKENKNEDISQQSLTTNQNSIQQQQQQFTPETIEHFNKICSDATELMLSYKQQSESLKQQISGMLNVYQKSTENTKDAVPVEKIIQITKEYQIGMREANREYVTLERGLKKQQIQRDQMMTQIHLMFGKLEKMEIKLRAKKQKQLLLKKEKQHLKSDLSSQNPSQKLEQQLEGMTLNKEQAVEKK